MIHLIAHLIAVKRAKLTVLLDAASTHSGNTCWCRHCSSHQAHQEQQRHNTTVNRSMALKSKDRHHHHHRHHHVKTETALTTTTMSIKNNSIDKRDYSHNTNLNNTNTIHTTTENGNVHGRGLLVSGHSALVIWRVLAIEIQGLKLLRVCHLGLWS